MTGPGGSRSIVCDAAACRGEIAVRDAHRSLNYYNYYTEIEETFVRRRGKGLLLSPLDWAMIEDWQERGIPLHVVLRAIESVFDSFEKNPRTRSIKSLMYCREEVEARFTEWNRSQAGQHTEEGESDAKEDADDLTREAIDAHLEKLIARLRAVDQPAIADDIERAVKRLEGLRDEPGTDHEHVDKSLGDIERLLDDGLLTRSDAALRGRLEEQVSAQLRPYKSSMEKADYGRTHRGMLLKAIRDETGIPRLTLFYI